MCTHLTVLWIQFDSRLHEHIYNLNVQLYITSAGHNTALFHGSNKLSVRKTSQRSLYFNSLYCVHQGESICIKFQIFQRFHNQASSFTVLPKTMKQAIFCRSLQSFQAEIELCANILSLQCDKTIKDRELIFVVRFLSPSSLKHKVTILLKKHTDFELLHLQNPSFTFFANVPKRTKHIKKILKQRPAMKSALSNYF